MLDKLAQKLRENNLRNTQARKEIYKLLIKSKFSLSPKEVFEIIEKKSNTDLVSVYRNLTLFAEIGLAHRFQDGKYSSCSHEHFHSHDVEESHEHIHFINHCSVCGRSSEIKTHSKEICQLARELKALAGQLKVYEEIVLRGRCSRCE